MKEYRIQCRNVDRFGDRWVIAHQPGHTSIVYTDKDKAMKAMEVIREAWAKHPRFSYKTTITEFRIISRTVTEWKPE